MQEERKYSTVTFSCFHSIFYGDTQAAQVVLGASCLDIYISDSAWRRREVAFAACRSQLISV